MDPLRLCLAFGPLAIYLLVVGVINLSRRPFLVSGGRDLAALGVAVSGFLMIGPIELLVPQVLAVRFGPWLWLYWLLMVALYFLTLTLVVLVSRPRLVIYNVTAEELRPVLAEVAAALDPDARWAGNALSLPRLGVELHVDCFRALRGASLVPVGYHQAYGGWRQLESALTGALRRVEVPPNPAGVTLIIFGLLIAAAIVIRWVRDPEAVAESFIEMLGL
jgi:hypothetical protein